MQIAVLGRIALVLIALVALLGGIGFILERRAKRRGEQTEAERSETENVANLNDRFNRARYMNED